VIDLPSVPRTILVVDDHVDLAENLAEILEGEGYLAVVVTSAEAALAWLVKGKVSVLLTDYRLPGRNGAQLIQALRDSGRAIPAVLMSAFTDDETIREGRSAGAVDVLAKPLELRRLVDLVGRMASA
jgi:CheY-like chemotaxis protein